MPSRRASLAVALLALALPLATMPAAAHCPPGTSGSLLGLISTCESDAAAEAAVEAANGMASDLVAFVIVKDFQFHPSVVRVKAGGTVVFLYADVDHNTQHDPRSSGPCANATVDPSVTPLACVPTNFGRCFHQVADDGQAMSFNGQNYPLTFRYTAPATLQKSRGFLSGSAVGDLTGAQSFLTCPLGSSINTPAEAVLPYHCGVHGMPETATKIMRGAIIVEA